MPPDASQLSSAAQMSHSAPLHSHLHGFTSFIPSTGILGTDQALDPLHGLDLDWLLNPDVLVDAPESQVGDASVQDHW